MILALGPSYWAFDEARDGLSSRTFAFISGRPDLNPVIVAFCSWGTGFVAFCGACAILYRILRWVDEKELESRISVQLAPLKEQLDEAVRSRMGYEREVLELKELMLREGVINKLSNGTVK